MMDRGRDMKARAGQRPWSVCIVRARSMGGRRRGDGPTEIVKEWPILPAPRVGDTAAIRQLLDPDQVRETGSVTLTEISSTYTEDVLLGRGTEGKPIPRDEWVYYEITWYGPDGKAGQKRRYVPDGSPSYNPERAEWSINLMRAHEDRERDGTPR